MNVTSALSAGADQDMYMRLLMAQLKNQAPTEPMSNSEMVTQLAQLSSLDVLNNLNASFKDVLKLQTLLSGTELLGKTVQYSLGGLMLTGTVESVVAGEDSIRLVVDGLEIGLTSVKRILSQ